MDSPSPELGRSTSLYREVDEQLETQIRTAEEEREKIQQENDMLEYYLSKKKSPDDDAKIRPEPGTELSPAALHEVALIVMEELADDKESVKAQTQKIVEEMKALMELNDTLVSERKKEVFEFSRDVVVGAENPRAGGKRMAEKVLQYFEKKLQAKDAQIQKLESKNVSLQGSIKKMEQQLRNKEQMGEVLNVIDFDQLKIENKQFLEKIEERNNELITLKLTTGNTVQVLNTLKKRLQKLNSESEWLMSEIVQRVDLKMKVEEDIERVVEEAKALTRANQRAKREQQTSDMPHVIEYVKQKLELDTLTKSVANWTQKTRIAEGELKRQRRKLREMQEGHVDT